MKLGIFLSALSLSGYALLAWSLAAVLGPIVWPASVGALLLLVALGVVGLRFTAMVIMDGARSFLGDP